MPVVVQPLPMSNAAAAQMTAPAMKVRLMGSMVTPLVVVSLFALSFTTDLFSKGWANDQARHNRGILANRGNAVQQIA
jgi:hypothetical protein